MLLALFDAQASRSRSDEIFRIQWSGTKVDAVEPLPQDFQRQQTPLQNDLGMRTQRLAELASRSKFEKNTLIHATTDAAEAELALSKLLPAFPASNGDIKTLQKAEQILSAFSFC